MKRTMSRILVLSILMVLCVTSCGLFGVPHTINQTPVATVTPNPSLVHEPNYEVQTIPATFLPANLTQLTVFEGWKPIAGRHLLYGHYDKNFNNEVCFREDINTEICDKKLNPDGDTEWVDGTKFAGIVWSPDGTKFAYFVYSKDNNVLRQLCIYTPATRKSEPCLGLAQTPLVYGVIKWDAEGIYAVNNDWVFIWKHEDGTIINLSKLQDSRIPVTSNGRYLDDNGALGPVYVYDPTGQVIVRLGYNNQNWHQPFLSHDGRLIAQLNTYTLTNGTEPFLNITGEETILYLYDIDTEITQAFRLTGHEISYPTPVWSLDSKYIAMVDRQENILIHSIANNRTYIQNIRDLGLTKSTSIQHVQWWNSKLVVGTGSEEIYIYQFNP